MPTPESHPHDAYRATTRLTPRAGRWMGAGCLCSLLFHSEAGDSSLCQSELLQGHRSHRSTQNRVCRVKTNMECQRGTI